VWPCGARQVEEGTPFSAHEACSAPTRTRERPSPRTCPRPVASVCSVCGRSAVLVPVSRTVCVLEGPRSDRTASAALAYTPSPTSPKHPCTHTPRPLHPPRRSSSSSRVSTLCTPCPSGLFVEGSILACLLAWRREEGREGARLQRGGGMSTPWPGTYALPLQWMGHVGARDDSSGGVGDDHPLRVSWWWWEGGRGAKLRLAATSDPWARTEGGGRKLALWLTFSPYLSATNSPHPVCKKACV